jgi:hypothetical protein
MPLHVPWCVVAGTLTSALDGNTDRAVTSYRGCVPRNFLRLPGQVRYLDLIYNCSHGKM